MAAENASTSQKTARYVLIGALFLVGAWMLRHFIPALCWAVVLAIATSRLYDRWLTCFQAKYRNVLAALTFTLLVGVVLIVPLVWGGVATVREAFSLLHSLLGPGHNGLPQLPQWLTQLPWVGDWVRQAWDNLVRPPVDGTPGGGMMIGNARPDVIQWTRDLGLQVVHRVVTLAFTLLTLFFVYANRNQLEEDVPRVCQRLFGPTVEPLLKGTADAIRATVDGIVLVAIAEGAIMAGVYAVAGAPHPVLFGALTMGFAIVPFAAPVLFGSVAILLASQGAVGSGIGVLVAGLVVLFIADHFVRPVIIGEGAKLPFLWVLLGILGGIESFGLVGIFVGPALMAALVSLWRGWLVKSSPDGSVPPPKPTPE